VQIKIYEENATCRIGSQFLLLAAGIQLLILSNIGQDLGIERGGALV